MGEMHNTSDVQGLNRQAERLDVKKPEQSVGVEQAVANVESSVPHNVAEAEHMAKEKVYHDDNGEIYRIGNQLKPNAEFTRNGYNYETDELGRTKSVSGKLRLPEQLKNRNMDNMEAVANGSNLPDDQRGHIFGRLFGGSDGIENLVPMNKELNLSDYKKMENKLVGALRAGKEVYLKVEPVYTDDSKRPTSFTATYSINGEKTITTFSNEGKQS